MPLSARAHERAAELLTGYVQGLLDAPEDRFVSDHLAVCPRCEHDVIRLTDTLCALHWAGDRWPNPSETGRVTMGGPSAA